MMYKKPAHIQGLAIGLAALQYPACPGSGGYKNQGLQAAPDHQLTQRISIRPKPPITPSRFIRELRNEEKSKGSNLVKLTWSHIGVRRSCLRVQETSAVRPELKPPFYKPKKKKKKKNKNKIKFRVAGSSVPPESITAMETVRMRLDTVPWAASVPAASHSAAALMSAALRPFPLYILLFHPVPGPHQVS